jgi:GxxExxY protein
MLVKTKGEENINMGKDSRFRKFRPEAFYGKRQKYEFEKLSENIIGAAINVHKELGPGFLENIYEEALKLELTKAKIHYESQKEIKIKYRETEIGTHRLDMIVENQIIIELKATRELSAVHFAQLRSYLKATGLKVGLLLNFAKPALEIKRIVN